MVFITTVTNIKREAWSLPLCRQRHSCGVRWKRHQDNLHRLGERDGEVGWPAEVAWVGFTLRFHEKQSSNIITLLNLSYLANVCLSLHQSTKTIIKQGITIVDISLPDDMFAVQPIEDWSCGCGVAIKRHRHSWWQGHGQHEDWGDHSKFRK